MYMLDTDICIYIIKRDPDNIYRQFRRMQKELTISSIVLCELKYGARKSSNPDVNFESIAKFTAPIRVLDFEPKVAEEYAEIRTTLESQGTPIGALDLLIAAHALALDATLITNNTREFDRVPYLKVENWAVKFG